MFTGALLMVSFPAHATILWSHSGTTLVCNSGEGTDILHGAIKPQGANSTSTLYFRIKVDPIADTAAKVIQPFEAGFMLVEKGQEHLGIGNARGALAYSALNVPKAPKGFQDLNSSVPDPPFAYEYMRAGTPRYLVLKIEYVPGQDARVTAWLNPDLSIKASEFNQLTNIVVHFEANATFDQFRLMHRGYGGGWKFSEMVVGTTFDDLLVIHFWQRGWFFAVTGAGLLIVVAGVVQLVERRRAQRQIRWLEQERVVALERARIARDIHDELGASLTKIHKLAEMMASPSESPDNADALPKIISHTARDTIRSMDEIVWAVNPQNDSLKEMADYMVYYAEDFLRQTGIACAMDVPLKLPDISVAAEVRHNLFMVVKEVLNNAVKHAAPKQIWFTLNFTADLLTVEIYDNGRGFRPDEATAIGNGLENIQRRLNAIGGVLTLRSDPGKGTTVKLEMRFPEKKNLRNE